MNHLKKRIKQEMEESMREFQKQLVDLNTQIRKLGLQEKAILEKRSKNQALEEKLKKELVTAKERYVKLKRRHALEMQGYQFQAKQLKLRLKQAEKLYAAEQNKANEK